MAKHFVLRCVLAGSLILATVVSYFTWRLGSLSSSIAYIAGERFAVTPTEFDLGECDARTRHIARFTVTNFTGQPIRIVGTEEGCPCVALNELPITVGPHASHEVSIRALVSGSEEYSQPIILYLDDQGLRSVGLRIRARVRQGKSES